MRKFDIEFEVHQTILYAMNGIEAETPEQAIEIAKHEDFDRHEAEEDTLLESYDDTDTIKVVGERIKDGQSSHRESFKEPVTLKNEPLELWNKYKASSGNKCPQCGSDHITAHPFNADNLDAWRDVTCPECDTEFREFFTMTYMEKL